MGLSPAAPPAFLPGEKRLIFQSHRSCPPWPVTCRLRPRTRVSAPAAGARSSPCVWLSCWPPPPSRLSRRSHSTLSPTFNTTTEGPRAANRSCHQGSICVSPERKPSEVRGDFSSCTRSPFGRRSGAGLSRPRGGSGRPRCVGQNRGSFSKSSSQGSGPSVLTDPPWRLQEGGPGFERGAGSPHRAGEGAAS